MPGAQTVILGEDELDGRDRRAAPRSTSVAFDHPLWVLYSSRHDRPAEGDRPVPGRHPARAPEGPAPARRRAEGRPALLVHHDRLDDVELHRLRAADRGDDPALRRLPRLPVARRAVGLRRAHGDDDVRDERELHRRVHEGRGRAGQGPRPEPRSRPSARPAPRSPPRASAGSTSTSARTRGCSRPAAAPTCARRSSAACPSCRCTRASCRRARSARPIESWDPDGKPHDRRGRRARADQADAVDADLLLGRRGRLALPRGVLRHLPRHLAPRRLDRDHRARHGDHHRPLRRDDQPRRHPHGHGRDLPRRAGRRCDHGRARRRRAGRGRGRVDAAVRRAARGRDADRRGGHGRSASGCARTARRATSRAT